MVTIECIADKTEPYKKHMGIFKSGNRLDLPGEVLNLLRAKMYGSYLMKQIDQNEHFGKYLTQKE